MKRAVCFILTLLILTLCACKDEEPKLSTADTLTNADISVLPDDEKDPENREENEIGSRVAHGIDVSKWQGKIDWQKVAKSGINFAVIRVGFRGEDGKIYPDENFDYNIQQAEKNGILVGVYFFSTAKTETEAKEEAAFTADKIKGYKIWLK